MGYREAVERRIEVKLENVNRRPAPGRRERLEFIHSSTDTRMPRHGPRCMQMESPESRVRRSHPAWMRPDGDQHPRRTSSFRSYCLKHSPLDAWSLYACLDSGRSLCATKTACRFQDLAPGAGCRHEDAVLPVGRMKGVIRQWSGAWRFGWIGDSMGSWMARSEKGDEQQFEWQGMGVTACSNELRRDCAAGIFRKLQKAWRPLALSEVVAHSAPSFHGVCLCWTEIGMAPRPGYS